jgi:hypothetical protein
MWDEVKIVDGWRTNMRIIDATQLLYTIGAGAIGVAVFLGLLYQAPNTPIHWVLFALSLPGLAAVQLVCLLEGNTHGVSFLVGIVVNGATYILFGVMLSNPRLRQWRRSATTRRQ